MAKSKLTPRQAAQAKRDLDMKDRLALETSKKMNAVLKDGVEQVYAHYMKTGKYKEPDISGLGEIFETFYKRVITEAVNSCRTHKPKKRLAALPDPQLPDGIPSLAKILKPQSSFFKSVMKRATALKNKALKAYLDKLKKQFQKVLPLLESTEISPKQIKQEIAKAWDSSKSRTETIFRTEATSFFAKAQVSYFEDSDDIIGFLFTSVRDTSRTPICKCREGMVMRQGSAILDKTIPPLHYNCRSALIPLTNDKENRALFENPANDPAKRPLDQYPPLPGFGTK